MSRFTEKIKGTKTFMQLNSLQQEMTLSKTNRSHLEHGVTVAKNIGLDRWKQICQFSERNLKIVEEIFTNENTQAHV